MKGFLIKIKSTSDVITNSSSEVFMIKNDKPHKSLKKNILDFHRKVSWYGLSNFDDFPDTLKWIISDEQIELLKENADGSSGMGGDCEVFDWENGLNEYRKVNNKPNATIENFAKYLKKSVDELQSVVLIDIDWACKGTINMISDKYKALKGDDCYNDKEYDFWYNALKYGI